MLKGSLGHKLPCARRFARSTPTLFYGVSLQPARTELVFSYGTLRFLSSTRPTLTYRSSRRLIIRHPALPCPPCPQIRWSTVIRSNRYCPLCTNVPYARSYSGTSYTLRLTFILFRKLRVDLVYLVATSYRTCDPRLAD